MNSQFTGAVAIKDDNGKIQKPEGWTAPDTGRFADKAPVWRG